jgi:hypothetical protein
MQVTGAVIRERGVEFAVVIVKPHVLANSTEAAEAVAGLTPVFGVPVVLMAQDSRGRPSYFGRRDLYQFMARVPVNAIPWRHYSIN